MPTYYHLLLEIDCVYLWIRGSREIQWNSLTWNVHFVVVFFLLRRLFLWGQHGTTGDDATYYTTSHPSRSRVDRLFVCNNSVCKFLMNHKRNGENKTTRHILMNWSNGFRALAPTQLTLRNWHHNTNITRKLCVFKRALYNSLSHIQQSIHDYYTVDNIIARRVYCSANTQEKKRLFH